MLVLLVRSTPCGKVRLRYYKMWPVNIEYS
jgi:hypothetical protein